MTSKTQIIIIITRSDSITTDRDTTKSSHISKLYWRSGSPGQRAGLISSSALSDTKRLLNLCLARKSIVVFPAIHFTAAESLECAFCCFLLERRGAENKELRCSTARKQKDWHLLTYGAQKACSERLRETISHNTQPNINIHTHLGGRSDGRSLSQHHSHLQEIRAQQDTSIINKLKKCHVMCSAHNSSAHLSLSVQ